MADGVVLDESSSIVMHSSGSWAGILSMKNWRTTPKRFLGVRRIRFRLAVATGSAVLRSGHGGNTGGRLGAATGSSSLYRAGSSRLNLLGLHWASGASSVSCSVIYRGETDMSSHTGMPQGSTYIHVFCRLNLNELVRILSHERKQCSTHGLSVRVGCGSNRRRRRYG